MALSFMGGGGLNSVLQQYAGSSPAHAPVTANANPQTPPPSTTPSAFNQLFPNFDLSQGFNPGYMTQFAAPGGGYGGDSGQYYDNGYQLKGTDGNMWNISPDFGGRGGYTLTSSDPLDNHNRYQLGFDASGKMTDNQNWKDKSWMDDNAGILAVLGAAAGGQMTFGGGFGGTGGSVGGVAETVGGTGAVSSPVYGATAVGTPLTGASPGVIGMGEAAAGAGGVGAMGGGGAAGGASGGITGNPILDKVLGSAASSGISSAVSGALGGGNSGGMSGLGGMMSGAYDYYAQNKAANNMLDYMKTQQAKIDSIYSPNGPVAKTMYDQMAAKDAAAGRNSQYGTRATDFLGKFGGDYAKYTAALAQGFAGNYQDAYNKQASAGTGLATGIGNAIGSGVNSGLNSVIQNMSSNVANNGAYTAGGQTYNNPSAYGGSTPYEPDTNDYYPTIY